MSAWLVLALLTAPSGAPGTLAPVASWEGAFLVELGLPAEFEAWCAEHTQGAARPDTSWPLAPLHVRPDSTAPRLGFVHAATCWRTQPYGPPFPDVILEFRTDRPGGPVVWIDGVGDWGYGIHTAARRVAGPWVLPPEIVFGGEAWVRVYVKE